MGARTAPAAWLSIFRRQRDSELWLQVQVQVQVEALKLFRSLPATWTRLIYLLPREPAPRAPVSTTRRWGDTAEQFS